MAKIGWGRILAGVATAAAAGAAYVYFRQRTGRAPIYERVVSDGPFEIRRYPSLPVLETVQTGSRDRALGNGFGLLAGYMFADGREGEAIPITMPVIAESLAGGTWRICFILPGGLARDDLDPPPDGITLDELPAREVAVMSVPGKPSDRQFANRTKELQRWIATRGRTAAGAVEQAYYNSPLEPGAMRPNEVFIALEATA